MVCPRRGCARDIKVTVPPRLRFESVGMMCWLHNNNSNSNKLSLTHWPKWSKDIKRIDRFFSRNLGSHRDASAWITVNTVNMQSILSYRVLPKGAWDTFASQRDTDGWNHSWELCATVSQSSPGNLCSVLSSTATQWIYHPSKRAQGSKRHRGWEGWENHNETVAQLFGNSTWMARKSPKTVNYTIGNDIGPIVLW